MSCTCSLSVSVSKSNDAVISTPNHLLGEKMMVVVVVLPGYSFSIEKRWWVWDRMMMRGMREVLLSSFKGLKSKESRGKKKSCVHILLFIQWLNERLNERLALSLVSSNDFILCLSSFLALILHASVWSLWVVFSLFLCLLRLLSFYCFLSVSPVIVFLPPTDLSLHHYHQPDH